MNKDLPLKVRHIFSELDPNLERNLARYFGESSMHNIWEDYNANILNKKKYPSILVIHNL